MISSFIFDLDGVIVSTAEFHFKAWKEISRELQIEFSERDNEKLKGVSREDSLRILLEIGGLELTEDHFEQLVDKKNRIYLELIENLSPTDILPAVADRISLLRAYGRKTGIASSSKNTRMVLRKIGLTDFFDVIVDGNRISKPKPDPEIFLTAAAELGTPARSCLVFEDAAAGVEAAKKAGMRVIGIGSKTVLKEADYLFEEFSMISEEFLIGL